MTFCSGRELLWAGPTMELETVVAGIGKAAPRSMGTVSAILLRTLRGLLRAH